MTKKQIKKSQDEDFIDFEFGLLIKSLRTYRNLSITNISCLTKIPSLRISELELGYPQKSVTKKECDLLSKALGVNMSVLITKALGN